MKDGRGGADALRLGKKNKKPEPSSGRTDKIVKKPPTQPAKKAKASHVDTGPAGHRPAPADAGREKPSKSKPGPRGAAWVMGHDTIKGRVMVAARNLEAGEIILDENPVVAGSWHSHRCIECHGTHASGKCKTVCAMYSKEVAQNMEQIESALVEMDQIDELDSARRFIKALNLCRSSRSLIECTAPCTAHNLEACEATLAKIAKHKSARHLIPPGVTPREAARLLSVLNTNSHELSEWGGSGFFLLACLMEHSCAPNCTFNTHETALWVTVTEPVPKGGALSIDYNDSLFEPTAERRAHLREAYGFDCICERCTALPDRTRAFLCPACRGTVCPRGTGADPGDWACLSCARKLKKEERKRMLRIEEVLGKEGPEDLEAVDEILTDPDTCFAATHHIVLDALIELAAEYSKDPDGVASGEAERLWLRVLQGAELVLRENHPHFAIIWDNIAQVRVAMGNAKEARKALQQAAEATRLTAGAGTPTTLIAQSLAESPPKSSAEMAGSYENFRERFAAIEREGLDGLAFFSKELHA